MRGLPLFLAPVFAMCALAGCTTVSAPPAHPAAPSAAAPPEPPGRPERPERPDGLRLLPSAPPAHHLLATTRPRRPAPPPAPSPEQRPAPRRRPSSSAPARVPVAPGLPDGSDVCRLGEDYGGWDPGSSTAELCHQVYGR